MVVAAVGAGAVVVAVLTVVGGASEVLEPHAESTTTAAMEIQIDEKKRRMSRGYAKLAMKWAGIVATSRDASVSRHCSVDAAPGAQRY